MNAHTLTVVMFHRVLPAGSVRWKTADPTWTISRDLFEECLDFFARHYHIVSLADLYPGSRLPPRALLVTFDDGWADNETYALEPLLRRLLPAVIFVVGNAIDGDECWQEPLLRAWSEGRLTDSECQRVWLHAKAAAFNSTSQYGSGIADFVLALARLPGQERLTALRKLPPEVTTTEANAMLTTCQIEKLAASGIAIQSHGLTHIPLGALESAFHELKQSRERLSAILSSGARPQEVFGLSFPHGSYNASVIRDARAAGYRLLFTSDPVLNVCAAGRPLSNLLGRIPIIASEIRDGRGGLDKSKLARWVFLRERTALRAC